MIVVDASTVLEVLLQKPSALRIEARLFARGETMHAPYLIDLEVTHVLRTYTLRGTIDEQRGQEALSDLSIWPMTRYIHVPLLLRIWALRHNITAYDASYIALAEVLNAPLITCDGRLAGSSGHHARIERY